jgi:NADPH:quinone reductase-like Zn-dependent oxidoreductase
MQPDGGRAVFFIVEPNRDQLAALEHKLRDGLLKPVVGAEFPLAEAPKAFDPAHRATGKTIIRVVQP